MHRHQRIHSATAHASERSDCHADLGNLQRSQLLYADSKQQMRQNLVLWQFGYAGQSDLRRICVAPDIELCGDVVGHACGLEVKRGIDLLRESGTVEADLTRSKLERRAGQVESAAPHIESATDLGRRARSADVQRAADFRIETAATHEDRTRRIDLEIVSDEHRRGGRRRRLLARPPYIEHRNSRRQRFRNIDGGAIDLDAAGGIEPRLRLSAQRQVRIHVGGQKIGCERLRIARGELQVDRPPRRAHAHATARGKGARAGTCGETRDPNGVAIGFDQPFNPVQVCAQGMILDLASSQPQVAGHARCGKRAANAQVNGDLTFYAAPVHFQNRIGNGCVDTAADTEIGRSCRR